MAAGCSEDLIDGKYKLRRKIDAGAFSDVYLGRSVVTQEEVAVKLEHRVAAAASSQLLHESEVYRNLHGGRGIPEIYWSGTKGDYNVLVMELLGPNLEDLLKRNHSHFSLKTVLMLALQMIERLEYIHSKHYIHRDIKPNNCLLGLGRHSKMIYIIDYGLSKRYFNPQTNEHIPYFEDVNLSGTPRYSSVNAQLGIVQSRRDDMESLGYVLIYLSKATLPWKNIKAKTKKQKYEKICESKLSVSTKILCQDLPAEFRLYLEYCRELEFDVAPDYSYLYQLFMQLLQAYGYSNDHLFDWTTRTSTPNQTQSGTVI